MLNTKSKVLLLRHTVLHSYIRRIGKKQLVINCECLQLCNVKYSRQCPTDGYHTRIAGFVDYPAMRAVPMHATLYILRHILKTSCAGGRHNMPPPLQVDL